jgi:uncharacterized repeat protein (TIGR02543 family)
MFVYTPTDGFTGRDSVKYTVTCAGAAQPCGGGFIGTIRIEVSPDDWGTLMKKSAELLEAPGVPYDGTRPNPAAVLFSDTIVYRIRAVNPHFSSQKIVIQDTLPAYLRFAPPQGSSGLFSLPQADVSVRDILPMAALRPETDTVRFEWHSVGELEEVEAVFYATPIAGVVASQPMFHNRAWVTVGDTVFETLPGTYHQGAGVSITTFSAGLGGSLYNASWQALDYRTSPRSGILIVPDDGYRFTGWSHAEYFSLRGERIAAASGVMHYDTLTVYGDVMLRADFALEEYSITYRLNGGSNAAGNVSSYTIRTETLTLESPEKAGDVFVGWTGSNGDEPQMTVSIPRGSTGERVFYANFLHSGREEAEAETPTEDRIWTFGNELYVRTAQPNSVVRVYTLDGRLYVQQSPGRTPGETRISLPPGTYIVTLNNETVGKRTSIGWRER